MDKERGFSLIELLTIIAIVGVLAAIALPMYANIKAKAFNARAVSDLKGVLSGQESYFVDNDNYLSECENAGCEILPGYTRSQDVEIISGSLNDGADFFIRSKHEKGSICYSVFSNDDNPDGSAGSEITRVQGDCPSS